MIKMTDVNQRNMTLRSRSRGRGFSLIEIMVVVVILGILAAVVVPKVMSRPAEARVSKVKSDLRAVESALKLYKLDNFSYPTTEQGLESLVTRPEGLAPGASWKQDGYLDRVPIDPWGNPYAYLKPGLNGEFDLYTLGADGARGGTDENADIGNWQLD
jgi:general secretion pathway protein G